MLRWLTLALVVGCAENDTKSCRIETFAFADVKDEVPTPCGSLGLDVDGGFTDSSMVAAHDCVLQAVADQHPFTLFYDQVDTTRHVRGGWTGALDAHQKLRIRSYAYVGDEHPVVTVQSCQTIVGSGCTPTAGRPCLSCSQPGTPSTLCRF